MKRVEKIVLAVLLFVFLLGLFVALTGTFKGLENEIAKFVNPNSNKNIIFTVLTKIGEVQGVAVVLAIFLLLPKTRKIIGGPATVNTLCSWLISTGIKELVKRPRPLIRLIEIGGYSFPSGHSVNNATLYLSIMLLALPHIKEKWQKIVLCFVCILMPLGIALSRVYFNVHYLSDVLAGLCLGSAIAIIGNAIFSKRKDTLNAQK